MMSYFQGLVEFVGAHPQLSFVAVFLLALSEAVPVIGTLVPGSTLILAVSALATTAGMTPWALLGTRPRLVLRLSPPLSWVGWAGG
jgi:membrane protein DedA with SNARE-associated domain